MNPNNVFGRQQDAFQTPSNVSQSGLFQPLGQQGASGKTPNIVFGQKLPFGQPSAFSQPPVFAQGSAPTSVFGQTSSFGQAPSFGPSGGLGQASSFSTSSQAPAFGQPASSQATLGFGAPPSSTVCSQAPAFGQVQAFGQTSGFGQNTGFGQTTSGFGISTSNSQQFSNSISSIGSQPNFGQTSFGQTPAFAFTSSAVSGQSNTQTSAFGPKISFKPSKETVFKPIFSASPVPPSVQPVSAPDPFGVSKPDSGVSDSSCVGSSGVSLFTDVKPSNVGFSFSQPGAVPSAPVTSASMSHNTVGMIGANNLQFTFSQPANPSGSSSVTNAAQPISLSSSPSAFSFTAQVVQPKTVFSHPSFEFGATKPEKRPEVKTEEGSGEEAFGSLVKGMKRKEEPSDPHASPGKTSKVEEARDKSVGPRHLSKRPIFRNQGAVSGLFINALTGVIKSSRNKKEVRTTDRASGVRPDALAPDVDVPLTPPRPQAPIRHALEKGEKSALELEVETGNPSRRAGRGQSTDSLSTSELTAIQCKGILPHLNRKDLVKKHFGRFGKVYRVYCRPEKNLAIVHFHDNASATAAQKKGKHFQGTEIQIFWQRKKQSPGTKRAKPSEVKDVVSAEEQSRPEGSPLKKAVLRHPAVSTSLVTGFPAKKSAVAKTLQFEMDSQQDVNSECQSVDRPVVIMPSSLQPLIGQIAETAEEKFRLLEQRDKILRQLRSKRSGLDMSKVFVGTCPDMCPEKERHMRETRNQLSVFELIPETEKVDHCAAIKEYSRSSADQEEPLPHELRPIPVLSMTMHYLVTQIMDQGEGNYGEWYDFVWNRTRGIRKDITQQHLCDPVTVSLIEKCARFHIHCAHHLCQEPMMSFDAKINNENLTKCLQSLKEMYQDLASKNVYCPNEAEFRQYSVLLKLNDGDILREVQHFRKEIRDSLAVKFAVQAFATLNSNNFVRFFKLVKASSYLSGCILHRYFNQVRASALKALNIAYTVGSQRSTTFPLEDLVRMLMFRNASEAIDFVQLYGLNVADGMVELSRTAHQEPDLPIPPKKSISIEKKKVVLIGEVVNGGPLPNPPQHLPVCSFDSNNKYKGDLASLELLPAALKVKPLVEQDPRPPLKPKLVAEPRLFTGSPAAVEVTQHEDTQETGESIVSVLPVNPQLMFQPIAEPVAQPIAQPQPVRLPSPKREPAYSDQDIRAEVDSVVEEILADEVLDIARAGAQYVSAALSVSESALQTIVSDVVAQMLREVSTSEITAEKERIAEEKRKLEEERRRKEREAFLDKLSSELCAEISEEVLAKCTRETAKMEIKIALEEKAACVARCTEEVCKSLVEETLVKEIDCLVREVVDAQFEQIHKFIKRWRDVVAVRRQLKRQMRGFPAAPCCVNPRFKLKALVPSAPSCQSMVTLARGLINLGNAGNMVVSCTRLLKTRNETLHQMRVDYYYNLLLSECVWSPLDLPTIVAESTPNPPDRIFWKATLLLPSDQDSDMSSALTKWLEVKLGGGERIEESILESEGKLKTLVISNSLRDVGQKTHKVHLCVKVSRGPLIEDWQTQLEEQNELLGTSSLLMLLPPLSCTGLDDEDLPLLSALLQLKQVQQASGWYTALPLALLIPEQLEGTVNDQKLEEVLMLKTLVQDGLISEYIFVHLSGSITDLQGSKQIGEAVRWLVAHSPASTVLSSQPLLQFVERALCREFYSRFLHDKQERAQASLPCQEPEVVTQLYNSVLVHLADVVSSETLVGISWPPPEFSLPENRDLVPHLDWNCPQHLDWLKRTILSLRIPVWNWLPPQNTPWPHLCTSIFEYVSQIPSSAQSQPILMSHLEHLLARVRAQHMQRDHVDEECHRLSLNRIPWDDILLLCIEHRLKDWHLVESPVAADVFTDKGEVFVYYYKEQLKDYLPPESWLAAVRRTHTEKQQNTVKSNMSSTFTVTPAARFPKQRLFQVQLETEEKPTVLDISHTPSAQELLPQRLLSGIQHEKAQSQRFEEQLQRWLTLEPLDLSSMPLFVPSTLLSMPEILVPKQRPSASVACSIQDPETEDPVEVPSPYRKLGPVSLSQRLKELDRLILANQEEERACSLKLNSLLEIIKD